MATVGQLGTGEIGIGEFILTNSEFINIQKALKPFIFPVYMECGFFKIDTDLQEAGFFSNVGDLVYWKPIEKLAPYQDCEFEYGADSITSDQLCLLGNYQTDVINKIGVDDFEQDHLSDLLGAVWKYMACQDPASARIAWQAFLLLKRVYSDTTPMVTGSHEERSITPYEL